MIHLLVLSLCHLAKSHYCNTPQCPEFSLIESIHVKEIRAEFIELTWEPKSNYTIDSYEVHWYAIPDCFQCGGQLSVLNSSVKISIKPCTVYTFEVYGLDNNLTTAPAIIQKMSGPSPLIEGSIVRIGGTWAIVRWLQLMKCPESSHIAVCYGPNILVQPKVFNPDYVVIFHFSNLNENSAYSCIAYTLNSAGSSSPSSPILIETNRDIYVENKISYESVMAITAIVILLLSITLMLFLLNRVRVFTLHWRRSYTVNETRI